MVDNIKKGYDEFLIKQIAKYIKQEINAGHSIDGVKRSLFDAGHEKNAIELAIKEIEKHDFKKFNTSKIDNETEKKIIEALEIFIEEQIKHGINLEKIKKILLNYGHSENLIEKALQNVKEKPIKKENIIISKKLKNIYLEREHILLTSTISAILLITICAAVIDEKIILVFLGFLPSITTILVSYYFSSKLKDKIFIVPFLSSLMFFIFGNLFEPIKNMEYSNLTIFNIVFSFIIVLLFKQTSEEIISHNVTKNITKNEIKNKFENKKKTIKKNLNK